MMKTIIKMKCVICEKEFATYDKEDRNFNKKFKFGAKKAGLVMRKRNTITCSPKCSKAFVRIYRRFSSNYIKKQNRNKNGSS